MALVQIFLVRTGRMHRMQPLIDVAVNFTYRIEHEAIPTLLLKPIVQLLLLKQYLTVTLALR